MKDIKNYLIAILAGLLVLTLTTRPSIGAGNSKEAKIIEYDNCIRLGSAALSHPEQYLKGIFGGCSQFKP